MQTALVTTEKKRQTLTYSRCNRQSTPCPTVCQRMPFVSIPTSLPNSSNMPKQLLYLAIG